MITLPQPPQLQGALGNHLTQLNRQIIQAFRGVPSATQAVPHVLLTSPDGTSFKITVANDGTITAGPP